MIDVPVLVKDALKEGAYRKNYRFIVLNDDGTEDFTIDNNTLVSESVNIDERMCSGDKIKFGLCEGSSLEFQYFNHPNITGRQLKVFVDVDYIDDVTVYTNVEQVSRWGGATVTEDGSYRVFSADNEFNMVHITRDGNVLSYTPTTDATGTYAFINALEGDLIEVDWVETTYVNTYLQSYVVTKQPATFSIPMGFFTVKNCSRQASTGIIKATCYNKLQSDYLDQKANQLILNAYDDKEKIVSVYDIKHLLLTDYAIEPYEETNVSYTEWAFFLDQDDASATKFNSIIGNQGPINPMDACDWASAPTAEFRLFVSSDSARFFLDTSKYYRIDSLYDLDTLERTFYEYLYNIVDMADINIDTDTYMNNLITKGYGEIPSTTIQGWKDIFAIQLTKSDDSVEIYSLYYPNSKGSMSDLCKTLFTGYKEIQIWFPTYMGRWNVNPQWQGRLFNFYGEDLEYEYIASKTGYDIETAIGTYPSFKYPDGKIIEERMAYEALSNIAIVEVENLDAIDLTKINLATLPDVTLRDLQSAVYETGCQFGQLDRETDLFSGVELNHSRLLPQETLYPSESLYPGGAKASGFKSMYSKLWADEGNIRKWKYLIITYKGLDSGGNETECILQRTVNADGTDNYNCSDNWLFKNLVWTAEQIGAYADAMVAKMQDITWFPFEMWCAGLPYLETGDEIEIPLGQQSYTSYVLQRQLKGIQNLQDTYINGTLDIF